MPSQTKASLTQWRQSMDGRRMGSVRPAQQIAAPPLRWAARSAWQSTQQPVWLRRLEAEHDNIRAALHWSVERGDAATAVRLAEKKHAASTAAKPAAERELSRAEHPR